MKVLDSELMKSYVRMASDGFRQGWHERNGGNLSYRMKPEEVEQLREDFNLSGEWRVIGWQAGDERAVVRKAEGDGGIHEHDALKSGKDIIEFRGIRLQELTPCRYIIEKIFYQEVTALGT